MRHTLRDLRPRLRGAVSDSARARAGASVWAAGRAGGARRSGGGEGQSGARGRERRGVERGTRAPVAGQRQRGARARAAGEGRGEEGRAGASGGAERARRRERRDSGVRWRRRRAERGARARAAGQRQRGYWQGEQRRMRARAAMCAGVLLAPATAPASAGTCARSRARVAVTRAHILWRAQRGGGNERDWPPERGAPAWPWWPQGGTGRLAATRRALPPVPGSPLYSGGFTIPFLEKASFCAGELSTCRMRVRVSDRRERVA